MNYPLFLPYVMLSVLVNKQSKVLSLLGTLNHTVRQTPHTYTDTHRDGHTGTDRYTQGEEGAGTNLQDSFQECMVSDSGSRQTGQKTQGD